MSSKIPSPGKPDPRIAPKEIMVTRHKSAQMKRQLRTKDRSMKHITDLLKSPPKENHASTKNVKRKQASPKAKQSLLQSVEKIQNLPRKTFKLSKVLRKEVKQVEDVEYHPTKRKRKLTVNKVVLKPKTTTKVVGEITGSAKRKYAVPLKASHPASTQVQQPSPEPARVTMAEAIQIMDEKLTDEDLMAILTCPSPVWWEDPPDERYIEDALFTRELTKKKNATTVESSPMEVDRGSENVTDRITVIPNLSAKSDTFLKKRSKLEDLLGNIKDKSNTNQNNENKAANDCVKPNEIKDAINKKDKLEAKMSESDDEIVFHNSSMNEDELLKDLENMDIPIANQNQANEVIVIDDDDDFLDKPTSEEAVIEETKKPDDQETVICDTNKTVDEITANSGANNTVDEITANSGTTNTVDEITANSGTNNTVDEITVNSGTNNTVDEISSPKSSDSLSSKSSLTSLSNKDLDTISDTNVQFLDEETDDQIVANKMDGKNEPAKDSSESKVFKDDNNVTVYKIIEEMSDSSTEVNEPSENAPNEKQTSKSKLHEAYKNCIKVYQKRMKMAKKDTYMNKNQYSDEENYTTKFCDQCKPSFKRVSDDENVKYCLSCSSIFDSNDCTYCMNNPNRTYTCDRCKVNFCCAFFYKAHEVNCRKRCRDELKVSDKLDIDPNVVVLSCPGYPVISRF